MLKNDFLSKNLITYLGNKRKLIPHIEKEIIIIKEKLKKEKITALDAFSGSGSVSKLLKYYCDNLYINDLEKYSYILNKCYLSEPSEEKIKNINKFIDELNNLSYDKEGIICKEYAPKNTNNIKKGERVFYTKENALIIDTIRDKINNYGKEYFHFLIAPLLVKASIHTNTSGVFKGFHKKDDIGHFGGKYESNKDSRIIKKIILEKPLFYKNNCKFYIFQNDINLLIDKLPEVDIAYLDPPYNQHPYGSNYHILNTIINNKIDNKLSKVAGIPKNWNKSDYNYKKSAHNSLKDLISKIKAKYIILSYNNEGIIKENEIIQLLDNLKLKYEVRKIDYDAYKGSRNLKERNDKVIEYLWIINKLSLIE